jgi:hypothetical protein
MSDIHKECSSFSMSLAKKEEEEEEEEVSYIT